MLSKTIQNLKDNLVRKSINVLILRVLGATLQIAVLLLITNYAKEELVGKYNYFNSVIILLGATILLGMNTAFLQFSGRLEAIGDYKEIVFLYRKKIIILLSTFSIALFVYLILTNLFNLTYFQDEEIKFVLDKVFCALLPFTLTLLNIEVLRALDFLYLSELIRNIGRFGLLLLFVLVLILYDNITYILDAFILSFIVLALISTIVILYRFWTFKPLVTSKRIGYKEIIKTSFPMSFGLLSLLIMQSIDVYVLELYFSFTVVAYYGVAIKISSVVAIILSSINATIAPQISKLFFEENMQELRKVILKATTLNMILTVPLILFIILFSDLILSFFGENYVIAKQALYIILFGQTINAFCGPVGLYLNMTGKQVMFQKILIIALIINLVMNFVLIPKYEMIGASISTAFSFVFWNIGGLILVYKKDKVNLSLFNFNKIRQVKR